MVWGGHVATKVWGGHIATKVWRGLWVGGDLVQGSSLVCVCVLGDVLSAEGIGPYCPVSGCLTVYLTVSASLFPQGKVEYLVKWKGWPPK